MASNSHSATTSRPTRSPTTNSTHAKPTAQPPHDCPGCTCHQQDPAPTVVQPAADHQRRCCLRHHMTTAQDANTRKFKSDDIKDGFKGLFERGLKPSNDPTSRIHLDSTQRKALLTSWDEIQKSLVNNTGTDPSPLISAFDVFNDYFFCRALKGRVDVRWTDECLREGEKGYTVDAAGPGHRATIHIKRPLHRTQLVAKDILQTLLHEMLHALFNVYECRCASCTVVEYRAANTGVSGHGPNWRELGTAVQEEAERMFEGVGGLELEAGVFGAGRKEELRTVLEMGSVSGAVRDAVLK